MPRGIDLHLYPGHATRAEYALRYASSQRLCLDQCSGLLSTSGVHAATCFGRDHLSLLVAIGCSFPGVTIIIRFPIFIQSLLGSGLLFLLSLCQPYTQRPSCELRQPSTERASCELSKSYTERPSYELRQPYTERTSCGLSQP